MPLDSANNQVDGPLGVTDVKRDRAFTLVEIIVALGIIMILVGLVTVGMRALNKSAKEKATKSALETAKSMLAELDTAGGIAEVTAIYSSLVPANQVEQPGNVTIDAYQAAPYARYQSDAVRLTQFVMGKLIAIPNNKAVLQKLPVERLLRKNPAGSAASLLTVDANGEPNPPVLLDGWGNPIIYVPWDGLSKVIIGNDVPPKEYRIKSNEVITPSTGADKFTTGRPFWASAGPDGDFSTGDDNVYSFED